MGRKTHTHTRHFHVHFRLRQTCDGRYLLDSSNLSTIPHPNVGAMSGVQCFIFHWVHWKVSAAAAESLQSAKSQTRLSNWTELNWWTSPPDYSVHWISQARILERVAISFSRGSSQPRDWTFASCLGRRLLYHWTTWKTWTPFARTYIRIQLPFSIWGRLVPGAVCTPKCRILAYIKGRSTMNAISPLHLQVSHSRIQHMADRNFQSQLV